MTTRHTPVCPLCGDTRKVRYGAMTPIDCPMHDGPLVDMPPESVERIQRNVEQYVREHPVPEPASFAETARDARASSRALGGVLVALSAVIMIALIVALVVIW